MFCSSAGISSRWSPVPGIPRAVRVGGARSAVVRGGSCPQNRRAARLPPANACLVVEALHVAEGALGLREASRVDLDLPEHHLRIQGFRVRLAERPPASGENGADPCLGFGKIPDVPHQYPESILGGQRPRMVLSKEPARAATPAKGARLGGAAPAGKARPGVGGGPVSGCICSRSHVRGFTTRVSASASRPPRTRWRPARCSRMTVPGCCAPDAPPR